MPQAALLPRSVIAVNIETISRYLHPRAHLWPGFASAFCFLLVQAGIPYCLDYSLAPSRSLHRRESRSKAAAIASIAPQQPSMNSFRESSRRGTNASAMTSSLRPGAVARASARQGTRASTVRHYNRPSHAAVPSRVERSGAVSPAESLSSVATAATAVSKRKER